MHFDQRTQAALREAGLSTDEIRAVSESVVEATRADADRLEAFFAGRETVYSDMGGGTPDGGGPELADLLPTDPPEGWAVEWGRAADEADRLARPDIQVDAVDCLDRPPFCLEVRPQSLDREQVAHSRAVGNRPGKVTGGYREWCYV
jgi:hypothetical protein